MSTYHIIETLEQLDFFQKEVAGAEWVCFDTEFVGEKRFKTLICLIQVTTVKGNYLLDPIRLPHIDPLIELLQDSEILKITHAGENDYRLFYKQYGILPKNTFDTQIAAGLLGYRYPSGLAKIVSGEINKHLKKGYAVTDWEARPFSKRQLDYALEDVIVLYPLWQSLQKRLIEKGRLEWCKEECQRMETAEFYYQHPHHEALTSNLMLSLKSKEQVFLLRLLAWRLSEAKKNDRSKNMIFPTKLVAQIVKSIRSGKQALAENRRLPDYVVRKFGDLFVSFYEKEASEEEKEILQLLPSPPDENARDEVLLELLYLLMKYRCLGENIAHTLVMPRNAIRRMKNDPKVLNAILGSGWRRELLGTDFVNWLNHYHDLELSIEGGQISIAIPE